MAFRKHEAEVAVELGRVACEVFAAYSVDFVDVVGDQTEVGETHGLEEDVGRREFKGFRLVWHNLGRLGVGVWL